MASTSNTFQLAKTTLRQELKQRLLSISSEERIAQSKIVTDMVLNSPEYIRSKRISIYLNMPEEVSTHDILTHIFKTKRQCFIPRYTKDDMVMLQLFSLEDYENLPLTKWNVRQPGLEDTQRPNALSTGGLDLILVPGLGFSYNKTSGQWSRLGRGKGYYDTYLKKCEESQKQPPITVALAFNKQIVDEIPMGSHDREIRRVFHS